VKAKLIKIFTFIKKNSISKYAPVMKGILIRIEKTNDCKAIKNVNDLTFNQKLAVEHLENQMEKEELIDEQSRVTIRKNIIVYHIPYFPISIISKENEIPVFSHAPMPGLQDFQNKGIVGTLLIEGLGFGGMIDYPREYYAAT
jgi:predicted N-acetyltransferase YhbS